MPQHVEGQMQDLQHEQMSQASQGSAQEMYSLQHVHQSGKLLAAAGAAQVHYLTREVRVSRCSMILWYDQSHTHKGYSTCTR